MPPWAVAPSGDQGTSNLRRYWVHMIERPIRIALVGVALVFALGLVLVSVFMVFSAFVVPGLSYETAEETVTGTLMPSEQALVRFVVEIDAADAISADSLKVALSVLPTQQTAVLGELIEGGAVPSGPRMIRIQDRNGADGVYRIDELDLDPSTCPRTGLCSFPVEATIGNLGDASEEWMIEATFFRYAEQDRRIEIPSFRIRVDTRSSEDGLWATTGPLPIGGQVGEAVAYAVSVATTISDSTRFDILITEPRQGLIGRTVEAVIGPTDLAWGLTYYEPSRAPLSSQASCDETGCRIDAVVIFRPGYDNDWWIPVVLPKPDAFSASVAESVTTIDVRRVDVATFEGEIHGIQGGTLTLELDAPLSTREALVWWQVKPTRFAVSLPPLGGLKASDESSLSHYRWFALDCGDRCGGDVTLFWEAPPESWEGEEVSYIGIVIGGESRGVAAESAPRVTIRTDR